MKPILTTSAVAVFLFVAASPCFALWGWADISKEEAKRQGIEVRSEDLGANQVKVELEFKADGEWKNFSGVALQIGDKVTPLVSAPLREDWSKPGRVVVRFTADRAQLDKARFSVRVPGNLGGMIYDVRVKDFVEPKKDR